MALDRREARALDAEARNCKAAPETAKLEGLLWAWAESENGDVAKFERLGAIAGVVGTWARRGRSLDAAEVLVVLEGALKAAGVTV